MHVDVCKDLSLEQAIVCVQRQHFHSHRVPCGHRIEYRWHDGGLILIYCGRANYKNVLSCSCLLVNKKSVCICTSALNNADRIKRATCMYSTCIYATSTNPLLPCTAVTAFSCVLSAWTYLCTFSFITTSFLVEKSLLYYTCITPPPSLRPSLPPPPPPSLPPPPPSAGPLPTSCSS